MPRNKRNDTNNLRKRSSRNNNDSAGIPRAPDPSQIKYGGPIATHTSERGVVAILRLTANAATGAGTSFVSILDNNPSGTDNWSEYSTSWSSYRVLGVRLQFIPWPCVNIATITTAPMVHTVLHASSITSPTNLSTSFSQGDSRVCNVATPFTRVWKMSNTVESAWIVTSAPSANSLCFATSAYNLTTGNSYGTFFITYMVQFRTSSI